MEVAGETTDGNTETDLYDENDIIAVFSPDGSLVSATRLERPLKIPGYWTEKTANLVYNSWHGKNVNIYRNTYWFQVPPIGEGVIYLGLAVQDDYRPKNITVDMHKQEDTNGCIFLVDDNTPDRNAKDPAGKTLPVFDKGKGKVVQVPLKQIDLFEPKFIVDILKSQGKKPEDVKAYDPKKGNRYPLGVMNIVRVPPKGERRRSRMARPAEHDSRRNSHSGEHLRRRGPRLLLAFGHSAVGERPRSRC